MYKTEVAEQYRHNTAYTEILNLVIRKTYKITNIHKYFLTKSKHRVRTRNREFYFHSEHLLQLLLHGRPTGPCKCTTR